MPHDSSEAPQAPSDGERSRRRKKKMTPREMAELPVVSLERMVELAREFEALKASRKYRRESPPLRVVDRDALERLPSIRQPASPGVFMLWLRDRIIYVGTSCAGLFGHGVAAHHYGSRSRYGVVAKEFDKVTFLSVPEGALDLVSAALTRLLRPKYNRIERHAAFTDEIGQEARDRELLARFGLDLVGWRGTSE